MVNWNCAAIYHTTWKDALSKEDPIVRAPENIVHSDGTSGAKSLHNSDSRMLCMVHAWAALVDDWVPEAAPSLLGVLGAHGYSVTRGFNQQVDQCFMVDSMMNSPDCSQGNKYLNSKKCFPEEPDYVAAGSVTGSCLHDVALQHCFSPAIMGAIAARQVAEYARYDGYNMYGYLNKDGTECKSNCHRYTDPTGYTPARETDSNNASMKFRWMPLLEEKGRGYFTRQEHVTPHIGTTAKLALLTEEERDMRVSPKPNYDYDAESIKVMNRLASLTDEKKKLIEFFDDKIDVAFAVIGNVAAQGASFEQILNYVVGLTASEYDSTILAWKEKVHHDLVRPTTWIQNEMSEQTFYTYSGPFLGNGDIQGKNFEAWVRVMPHSEYPSGSGCICQAMYEHTDEWLALTLGKTDSISIPLSFKAGFSKTEPGKTPANDINITINNMLELRNICGQSRLDGGMHFTRAVDEAYKLCQGVGKLGAHYAADLMV
jgi:hypothetical protein